MRAIVFLALAGWMNGGATRYHFTDDEGRPFELRLTPMPTKVDFELVAAPQPRRLYLRTTFKSEKAQTRGRYAMGYPIPEYMANAGILAGGATLLGTILADFLTHPAPIGP